MVSVSDAGRITEQDAALAGGFHVDVVVADGHLADDFETEPAASMSAPSMRSVSSESRPSDAAHALAQRVVGGRQFVLPDVDSADALKAIQPGNDTVTKTFAAMMSLSFSFANGSSIITQVCPKHKVCLMRLRSWSLAVAVLWIVAAFLLVNSWLLQMHSDEELSYRSTNGDLAYTLNYQMSVQDNQAPLWFVTFWAWRQLVGDDRASRTNRPLLLRSPEEQRPLVKGGQGVAPWPGTIGIPARGEGSARL